MTIQMAAQHHQLKLEYEIAEQQEKWLQTFIKVGQVITSIHSFDEVLSEVHHQVGKLMDVSEMDIVLYEEASQTLHFELCYDRAIKQEKWQRPFSEGFTEWVIENKQPLLIKNYDQEKENLPIKANIVSFGEDNDDEITQSHLSVPLIAKDHVIGVINIQSYPPNQFDETDQYVLSAVASQVAVAIENARLISSLHKEREHSEALLQSSLDAIVAIDNNKQIIVFNKQAEKFFGFTESEMLGEKTFSLFEDIKIGRQIFKQLDDGSPISELPVNFMNKGGQILPGMFSATVIRDEAGKVIGQAGFVRDLREIKVLEERQRVWSDVSQAVTKSKELGDILNLIMRSVDHIIPTATGGEFHLYQDGILQLVANTFNFSDEAITDFSLKVGEGVAGEVFETGNSLIVRDSKQDKQFKTFDHPEAPDYRSMICVPLQVQSQTLGTLSLTSKKANHFREIDFTLLKPFAEQAAIAIKNKQLLDEATNGLATLKSISEASRNLISQQNPEEVLQAIVEQAKESLQAWRASAILIDHDGYPSELAADGYETAPKVESVIRKKGGISAQVKENMEPCFIEDVTDSIKSLNEDMVQDGVLSAACLPLKLGDKAIGVMWIQYQKPHLFTPTEREALVIYSEQAALAYDKSRRMQELKHMREAVEALSGAANLPDVLTQIVHSARIVLGADSAAIWSYDAIRRKFLLDDSVADGIESAVWQKFKQEEPRAGQTAATVMENHPLSVENVADQERYSFLGTSTKRLLTMVGIQSFLGLALTAGEENLGVLYVNFNQLRRFTDDEINTALTFADQVALALKKARLLEQVRRARNAARIVAAVTTLESENVLESVAQGMVNAVNCDAVTLYVYNEKNGHLSYPPTMGGKINFPEKTHLYSKVPENSIVLKTLHQDEPTVVEDSAEDALFRKLRFTKEENIKSLIGIPLKAGKQKVGVMFVNYRQPHRFTNDEYQNIELFANQAAVAIRNSQLYEQVAIRSKFHQALYKANKAISDSLLDEKTTLDAILEQAVHITKRKSGEASYACIREVENGVSRLISVYPPHLRTEPNDQQIVKISPEDRDKRIIGVIGRAALTETAQRVGDVSQDLDYRAVDPEVQSELAVPFKSGKAVIVINVEHKDKDAYDEVDEEALKILASQAAIAVDNAQLYKKSDTFREVAEALSSTNKLDDVLNVVIREAMTLTNTVMGNITFWDSENNEATNALRVENDGKLYSYPSVARKNGTTRQIVDSRQAAIIPDKRLEKNPNPIYKIRGFLAEVGVPIVNGKKVLGVMYVRHPEPRHFPERQVDMLKTLGHQAGVAIARARHFEEMRRLKGFIGNKTAVEWIQMVSTTWVHSIKREIGIAMGRMALLNTLANPKEKHAFEAEMASLKNVLKRIADLHITAPLTYEDGTKAVYINTLLQTYLIRQWKHARYKNISLNFDLQSDLDKLASAWASPEWLRRGFELIIDNAVWAMEDAKTPCPKIIVTTRLQEAQIVITFDNNGPPISGKVLELFREGRAIPKKDGDRGSGIGLQLTQTIFETYRGTMKISGGESQGTKVTFTLPLHHPNNVNTAKVKTRE